MYYIFLAALFGATLQEAMYWYGKRYSILASGVEKSKGLKIYAIIVGSMIILSSIGTVIWFEGRFDSVPLKDAALLGAAFPSIFKIAVKSYKNSLKSDGPDLGKASAASKVIDSYF